MCVQRAQRIKETEIDSVELISRIEVKHKERNNDDSGRSVTGNGGDKDWSSDGVEAQMQGMREWKGR